MTSSPNSMKYPIARGRDWSVDTATNTDDSRTRSESLNSTSGLAWRMRSILDPGRWRGRVGSRSEAAEDGDGAATASASPSAADSPAAASGGSPERRGRTVKPGRRRSRLNQSGSRFVCRDDVVAIRPPLPPGRDSALNRGNTPGPVLPPPRPSPSGLGPVGRPGPVRNASNAPPAGRRNGVIRARGDGTAEKASAGRPIYARPGHTSSGRRTRSPAAAAAAAAAVEISTAGRGRRMRRRGLGDGAADIERGPGIVRLPALGKEAGSIYEPRGAAEGQVGNGRGAPISGARFDPLGVMCKQEGFTISECTA